MKSAIPAPQSESQKGLQVPPLPSPSPQPLGSGWTDSCVRPSRGAADLPRDGKQSSLSSRERAVGGYGVPALAGRALSLGGGSKYLPIHGETPSHRLKPGLHTLPSTGAVPQCPCRQGSGDKRRHWTAPPSHPWPISVVSVTPPILGRPSETEPFVPPPSLVSGALLLATSVVPP